MQAATEPDELEFYDVEDLPPTMDETTLGKAVSELEEKGAEEETAPAKSVSAPLRISEASGEAQDTKGGDGVGDVGVVDRGFIITDLDTSKKYHVEQYAEKSDMTLDTFKRAQRTWTMEEKAYQKSDAKENLKDDPAHQERKEQAGWFSRVFSRRSTFVSDATTNNRVPVRNNKKPEMEFENLRVVQELNVKCGPIWCMEFSKDGNFLAAAGSDAVVRVWRIHGSSAEVQQVDRDAQSGSDVDSSLAPDSDSLDPLHDSSGGVGNSSGQGSMAKSRSTDIPVEMGGRKVLEPVLFRKYKGHSSDVVDLSWSGANFLLSASLDKTVRLWHVSKRRCLCKFKHSDFVTSVAFHPTQVKLFISGSYDNKLRVWNVLENRVESWAHTDAVITAANFTPDGKLAVAGLVDGQCVFYRMNGLKYFTQIDCRNRHGKFSNGRKVTGLEFSASGNQLLVTTCDSRIRLINMSDKMTQTKFKGLANERLPIRATFSNDGSHVICGSEDNNVYIWKSDAEDQSAKRGYKKDRNSRYEFFRAHDEAATVAIFVPQTVINMSSFSETSAKKIRHMIVSSGFDGVLRIYESK